MENGSFRLPRGVFVTPHIIRSGDCWPLPAAKAKSALVNAAETASRDAAKMASRGAASFACWTTCSEERHAAACIALRGWSAILGTLQLEADHPELGPETKRVILGPLIGQILQTVEPRLSINFDVAYSRALHPCYANTPASCVLPSFGRATSVVTLPVNLLGRSADHISERLTGLIQQEHGNSMAESTSLMDVESSSPQQSHNLGPFVPVADSDLYGGSAWLDPDDELHPYSHAHLLLPQRPHESTPFPVACVAPHGEIYELLSSALFQRRIFGLETPLLGFAFDPLACYLQVVVAWLSPHTTDGHQCVQVNMAHAARPQAGRSSSGSSPSSAELPLDQGIFDISSAYGALALASFLLHVQQDLVLSARTAQKNTPSICCTLLTSTVRTWRVNLVADNESFDHPACEPPEERVLGWIRECREAGLRGSPTDVVYMPPKAQTARTNTSATIPEKYAADSKLKDLKEQLDDTNRFALHRAHIKTKYRSSSQAALPPKEDDEDVPTQILADRLYSTAAWPPTAPWIEDWPEKPMAKLIHDMMFSHTLLTIPDFTETIIEHSPVIDSFSGDGSILRGEHQDHRVLSYGLDEGDVKALVVFVDENVIENNLRALDPNVGARLPLDEECQEILMSVVHTVRDASMQAQKCHKRQNEAEARFEVDKIVRAVWFKRTTQDGIATDVLFERFAPLARSDIYDHYNLLQHLTPGTVRYKSAFLEMRKNHAAQLTAKLLSTDQKGRLSPKKDGEENADEDRKRNKDGKQNKDKDADERKEGNDGNRYSTSEENPCWKRLQRALCVSAARAVKIAGEEVESMEAKSARYVLETPDSRCIEARVLRAFKSGGSKFDASLFCVVPDVLPSATSRRTFEFFRFFAVSTAGMEEGDTQPARPPDKQSTAAPAGTLETPSCPAESMPSHQELLGESRDMKLENDRRVAVSLALKHISSSQSRLGSVPLQTQVTTATETQADSTSAHADPQAAESTTSESKDVVPDGGSELAVPECFIEYKPPEVEEEQCFNQARFDLQDAVMFYAAWGIFDFPVFAFVVVGSKAKLLAARGEKLKEEHIPPKPYSPIAQEKHVKKSSKKKKLPKSYYESTCVRMLDTNCPTWDITDCSQALRFTVFLILLRTAWTRELRRRFEAAKDGFHTAWKEDSSGRRFRWKMAHQREEPEYQEMAARLQREEEEVAKLKADIQKRVNVLQDQAKGTGKETAGSAQLEA
ncbi:hypothetical protein BD626DRAFT_484715 [Schizophyllum amplum]|uniref:Uncharacterized protein n=1 Tax=Schizophyllum amplum TaxID=97359 RepID=A0A550CQL3_9AGAR|nr:hypothetical protein BD626DRAFT_484715 [Auriculariopsis ampla]